MKVSKITTKSIFELNPNEYGTALSSLRSAEFKDSDWSLGGLVLILTIWIATDMTKSMIQRSKKVEVNNSQQKPAYKYIKPKWEDDMIEVRKRTTLGSAIKINNAGESAVQEVLRDIERLDTIQKHSKKN